MLMQKYKSRKEKLAFHKQLLAPHPKITASKVYIDVSRPYNPVVTGVFTIKVYVPSPKLYKYKPTGW